MFNSITYKNESKVVAVTKEIEKTITPDKVTEMYDKCKAQAEKDLIRAVRVEGNFLNGTVFEYRSHYAKGTLLFHYHFVLNGRDFDFKDERSDREFLTDAQLYEKLREFFISTITNDFIMRELHQITNLLNKRK